MPDLNAPTSRYIKAFSNCGSAGVGLPLTVGKSATYLIGGTFGMEMQVFDHQAIFCTVILRSAFGLVVLCVSEDNKPLC